METEIWKDIPGYEGLYQVSSFGRVRGVERIVKSKNNSTKTILQKPLKISKYKIGYEYICLSKFGVRIKNKIHRIVASAFIENPLNKREVNHIDGNKSNNNVSNLEWATSSENQQHAYNTGLQKSLNYLRVGCKNSNSKIVQKLSLNKELIEEYECVRIAAEIHGISNSLLSESCRNERYKTKGFLWRYK